MKLLHPDAAFNGSHILRSIPQVLVHLLDDETSPLVPPRSTCWYDSDGGRHISPHAAEIENMTLDDAPRDTERGDLEAFLLDREAKIIALVEGTDEEMGAATQASHSYRPSDLVWNYTSVPCVTPHQTTESKSWVRRQ
jgi:hypothetical protein